MRILTLFAVGTALVVSLTSCGSSDDSITKAEFVEQADEICRNIDAEQEKMYKEYAKTHKLKTKADEAKLLKVVLVPTLSKEIEELGSLEVPEGDDKEISALIVAVEKGLADGTKEPLSLVGSPTPFTPADNLAKKYGFKDCTDIF